MGCTKSVGYGLVITLSFSGIEPATSGIWKMLMDSCVLFGYYIQKLLSWKNSLKLSARQDVYIYKLKQKTHLRIIKTTEELTHRRFVFGEGKCCFFQLSIYDMSGTVELLSKCILPQDRQDNESLRFSRFTYMNVVLVVNLLLFNTALTRKSVLAWKDLF